MKKNNAYRNYRFSSLVFITSSMCCNVRPTRILLALELRVICMNMAASSEKCFPSEKEQKISFSLLLTYEEARTTRKHCRKTHSCTRKKESMTNSFIIPLSCNSTHSGFERRGQQQRGERVSWTSFALSRSTHEFKVSSDSRWLKLRNDSENTTQILRYDIQAYLMSINVWMSSPTQSFTAAMNCDRYIIRYRRLVFIHDYCLHVIRLTAR